jgi:hypothetical protein
MRIWHDRLTQGFLAILIGSTLFLVRASTLPHVTLSYTGVLPRTGFDTAYDHATAALPKKEIIVAVMLITILLFPPDLSR